MSRITWTNYRVNGSDEKMKEVLFNLILFGYIFYVYRQDYTLFIIMYLSLLLFFYLSQVQFKKNIYREHINENIIYITNHINVGAHFLIFLLVGFYIEYPYKGYINHISSLIEIAYIFGFLVFLLYIYMIITSGFLILTNESIYYKSQFKIFERFLYCSWVLKYSEIKSVHCSSFLGAYDLEIFLQKSNKYKSIRGIADLSKVKKIIDINL